MNWQMRVETPPALTSLLYVRDIFNLPIEGDDQPPRLDLGSATTWSSDPDVRMAAAQQFGKLWPAALQMFYEQTAAMSAGERPSTRVIDDPEWRSADHLPELQHMLHLAYPSGYRWSEERLAELDPRTRMAPLLTPAAGKIAAAIVGEQGPGQMGVVLVLLAPGRWWARPFPHCSVCTLDSGRNEEDVREVVRAAMVRTG